ncbi:hypothetical protein [Prauserella muralis]|uniref:Uncharacterized protein n=1 Tax=Prauserella muralis TaxID=588067 RepID=A0A2V4AQ32_9PSEU|nr:hypothetical protein [Prauserella muralis]PXY22697.1 hypothetical protein BAY60_23065 [Prauserella muralis]TWE28414.1 hypothetical protein FHX69_1069 [Prauserella muralis]
MDDDSSGDATVDAAALLALLAQAEQQAREDDRHAAGYRDGAVDAYLHAQDLVRGLVGWPVEPKPIIDQP